MRPSWPTALISLYILALFRLCCSALELLTCHVEPLLLLIDPLCSTGDLPAAVLDGLPLHSENPLSNPPQCLPALGPLRCVAPFPGCVSLEGTMSSSAGAISMAIGGLGSVEELLGLCIEG